MKHLTTLSAALAILALLSLSACGSATTAGSGTIVVTGLAPGQTLLCASQGQGPGGNSVVIQGSGFLSEHGSDIEVFWTALSGTPFDGGSSATTQTVGTVLSDSLVEVMVPNGIGTIQVTITVRLPGGNEGTSQPTEISIGGVLVGPFAISDFITGTIGNVPTTVAAPGVLANDQPLACAEEDESPRKPAGPTSTHHVDDFAVVTPLAGFESDATPGMEKATTLGGTVTIQADGSFVYSPPVGVTDQTDSFFYWMQDGAEGPSRTIVQLPITDMVWFLDKSHSGANTGHFSDPYQSVDDFMNEQGDGTGFPAIGHTIFVHQGGAGDPYDGMLGLLNRQRLLGEAHGLTINGREIVAAGPRPVLVNSDAATGEQIGDTVIQLADENEVRGLGIEAPNEYGVLGVGVAGPTLIDDVRISDCNSTGIRLVSVTGTFQVGDPQNMVAPTFVITGCGVNGIEITGQAQQIDLQTAAVGGPTLNVFGGVINGVGSRGIMAVDANVDITGATVDNCNTGIQQTTLGTDCAFALRDSELGLTTPHRFRGILLEPIFFGSSITATLSNNSTVANEEALYGGSAEGGGLVIALDSNTWENLITGNIPAVRLEGEVEGAGTIITQMNAERYNGNGNGGGCLCFDCVFDADPNTAAIEAVTTSTLDFGNSTAARIEFTSLQLVFCEGALDIGTFTVFQVGGDASGFFNNGGLALTITTGVVDVTP